MKHLKSLLAAFIIFLLCSFYSQSVQDQANAACKEYIKNSIQYMQKQPYEQTANLIQQGSNAYYLLDSAMRVK